MQNKRFSEWANTACISFCMFIAITPAVSAANDSYQSEFAAIYESAEDDSDFESTLMLGGLAYYFKPVSYKNGPYAEADFLDRQTAILGGFGLADLDFGGIDLDGNVFLLAFIFAEQTSPLTFGITYLQLDADENIAGNSVDVTSDTVGFELGFYLDDHSQLSLNISQGETEFEVNGAVTFEDETDVIGIGYKNVMSMSESTFLGLELGYTQEENIIDEKNTTIGVGASYYVDRMTGIVAEFAVNSGDDTFAEGTTITLGFSKFFSKTAGIYFEYEDFSADEDGGDGTQWSIEFNARFN